MSAVMGAGGIPGPENETDPVAERARVVNAARARSAASAEGQSLAYAELTTMLDRALLPDAPQIAEKRGEIAYWTARHEQDLFAQGQAERADASPRHAVVYGPYLESAEWKSTHRTFTVLFSDEMKFHTARIDAFNGVDAELRTAENLMKNAHDLAARRVAR
jgi:hypothetical protein